MSQFTRPDKEQWRQLQGATGNDTALVIVNGAQQAGNFLRVGDGGHVFTRGRGDSAAQVGGRVTLGPAGSYGITEDLPAVLSGPVRRIKCALGLNSP